MRKVRQLAVFFNDRLVSDHITRGKINVALRTVESMTLLQYH